MREYTWMKNDHNSLYKNIFVFLFFRKELKLLWFVRQTDVGRKARLLHWPITSSFDHCRLCHLQNPLSTSSASRPGFLSQGNCMGHRPQQARSQWLQTGSQSGLHCLQPYQLETAQLEAAALTGVLSLTANWLPLWPSQTPTFNCRIYYFTTPTYFRLDHMIFFRLFTQVRLWLTAQSRVNM